MEKRKAGLHKKVSSIFDGVKIPGLNDAQIEHSGLSKKLSENETNQPPVEDSNPKIPLDKEKASTPGTDDSRPNAPKDQNSFNKPFGGGKTYLQRKYNLSAPIPGVSDRKQKIKMLMIPVLVVVFLFIMVINFGSELGLSKAGNSIAGKIESKLLNKPEKTEKQEKVEWKLPDVYPARLPDPMESDRPTNPTGRKVVRNDQEAELPFKVDITIQGILYGQDKRSVVIDNEILYEGDSIAGFTVVKINKDSVEFEKDGIRFSRSIEH